MSEPTVLETWRVVDRWWTECPTEREYRIVERDGREVVQRREVLPDATEWEDYDPPKG